MTEVSNVAGYHVYQYYGKEAWVRVSEEGEEFKKDIPVDLPEEAGGYSVSAESAWLAGQIDWLDGAEGREDDNTPIVSAINLARRLPTPYMQGDALIIVADHLLEKGEKERALDLLEEVTQKAGFLLYTAERFISLKPQRGVDLAIGVLRALKKGELNVWNVHERLGRIAEGLAKVDPGKAILMAEKIKDKEGYLLEERLLVLAKVTVLAQEKDPKIAEQAYNKIKRGVRKIDGALTLADIADELIKYDKEKAFALLKGIEKKNYGLDDWDRIIEVTLKFGPEKAAVVFDRLITAGKKEDEYGRTRVLAKVICAYAKVDPEKAANIFAENEKHMEPEQKVEARAGIAVGFAKTDMGKAKDAFDDLLDYVDTDEAFVGTRLSLASSNKKDALKLIGEKLVDIDPERALEVFEKTGYMETEGKLSVAKALKGTDFEGSVEIVQGVYSDIMWQIQSRGFAFNPGYDWEHLSDVALKFADFDKEATKEVVTQLFEIAVDSARNVGDLMKVIEKWAKVDKDAALKSVDKALEIAGDYFWDLRTIAAALAPLDPQKALEVYEKAFVLSKNIPSKDPLMETLKEIARLDPRRGLELAQEIKGEEAIKVAPYLFIQAVLDGKLREADFCVKDEVEETEEAAAPIAPEKEESKPANRIEIKVPAEMERQVFFISQASGYKGEIHVMDYLTGESRQLTRDGEEKLEYRYCPQNRRLFYHTKNSDSDYSLFMKEDGSEPQRIFGPSENTVYLGPTCSYDGKYLSVTFWNRSEKTGEICVYDLSQQKCTEEFEGFNANWSAWGDRLIYLHRKALTGSINKMNIFAKELGTAPVSLYQETLGDWIYDLSDPKYVGPGQKDFLFRVYDEHEYMYYSQNYRDTFISTRDGAPFLHHGDEDGENLEQFRMALSYDGKWAVLEEALWGSPAYLLLVDLESRGSKVVSKFGYNAHFTLDSKNIVFNYDPDYHKGCTGTECRYPRGEDGYEIYRVDLKGENLTRLTDNYHYDGLSQNGE